MMFVYELLDILEKNKGKFKNTGNCYFKDVNGEIIPFDFVEFLSDGTLIVSENQDEEN